MLQIVNSSLNSRFFLSIMEVPKLKEPLLERFDKDPQHHSKTTDELDTQVFSVIGEIETAMTLAILEVRL